MSTNERRTVAANKEEEEEFREEFVSFASSSKNDEDGGGLGRHKISKESKIHNTDTVLWITYVNIVLYALSYQLQRPVEPYLIQSLIEKEEKEGLLLSTSTSTSSASSVNQT